MINQLINDDVETEKPVSQAIGFHEFSYIHKGLAVPVYYMELPVHSVGFKLSIVRGKMSLLGHVEKFQKKNNRVLCAINIGQFYNTDMGREPDLYFYNLCIKNGVLVQPPSFKRPTILVRNGNMEVGIAEDKGSLVFNSCSLSWVSSGSGHDGNILYGLYDVRLTKGKASLLTKARPATVKVAAAPGGIVIGFQIYNNKVVVNKISKFELSLLDHIYILKVDNPTLAIPCVGDLVKNYTIKGLDSTARLQAVWNFLEARDS